jgi:hypothetical protein
MSFFFSFPSAPQLSLDVPTDSSLLCDEAAVIGEMIKETLLFLRIRQCVEVLFFVSGCVSDSSFKQSVTSFSRIPSDTQFLDKKGKVISVHRVETYRRGDIALLILNLGVTLR